MIWIVAILVLLFGAKKLPQLARGIGESIGEFKKARKDFDEEVKAGEKTAEKKIEEGAGQNRPPSSETAKEEVAHS